MKLELKHLAPYLPYGLKCVWGKHTFDIVGASELKRLSVKVKWYNQTSSYTDIKPLLRPLSDLTENITVNNEDFVPYEHPTFVEAMIANEYLEYLCEVKADLSQDRILPYSIFQLLFEWHFDVFGLIPKGLAVDINDVSLAEC